MAQAVDIELIKLTLRTPTVDTKITVSQRKCKLFGHVKWSHVVLPTVE
jgi:hypothetical protein